MKGRVLVAGIGNIFLGDDAFGVEVARRMDGAGRLPDGVEVADFGIRGMHLAYEMLEREGGTTILVDAMARGGAPGTLYVLEPGREPDAGEGSGDRGTGPDAHAMSPAAVLRWLDALGGRRGRLLVVGCEPASTEEGMGLSAPVAAAVPAAIDVIVRLATEAAGAGPFLAPAGTGGLEC